MSSRIGWCMSYRFLSPLFLYLFFILLSAGTVQAKSNHAQDEVKKGILLVTFGTSIPQAAAAFDDMEKAVRRQHPGVPVRWAFTSNMIRKKLRKTKNQQTDSLPLALAKMYDDGFTHVAVQSLHTLPGQEFHQKVLAVVNAFRTMPHTFTSLAIGEPLLLTDKDIRQTAQAALTAAPQLKKNEALLLMGHGTHHPANVYYLALQHYLAQLSDRAFIGTVEGAPLLDEIVPELKKRNIKQVCLMPFMSVAGDHAINDMAGDEEDSWKSLLKKHGFTTRTILKGTAQLTSYRKVWLEHLQETYSQL